MNGYEKAKIIAETFSAICIGIGALLGGLGALKVLSGWSDKREAKRQKHKLKKLFPKEKLNQDFKLLRHSYAKDTNGSVIGSSNNVYICDSRTKKKHWVANEYTLTELAFNKEEVEGVKQSELDKFSDGEAVNLSALQAE